MPKHKKTRDQKIKADQRKTANIVKTQEILHAHTYAFSASHTPSQSAVKNQEHVNTVVMTIRDLRKTALVSVAIVVLQIIFYFLLHNHMLAISFVRY